MTEKQEKLSDLQEIIFWQQLNKQLLELKAQGESIRDEHHKFLQDFFLDNKLFARLTRDPFIDEIPLSLITDLSDTGFISLGFDPWISNLSKLLPLTYVFNIEGGLADAFDVTREYDQKYQLTEEEQDDEDDEDIYDFINKYQELRERQGRNFNDIIAGLYNLKNNFIETIVNELDFESLLVTSDNFLVIDIGNLDNKTDILNSYFDLFCSRAESAVNSVTHATKDLEISAFLYDNKPEKDLKPSLHDFVEYETLLFNRESGLFVKFLDDIQNRLSQPLSFEIKICSTSPFFFLDHPLPVV